MIQPAASSVRLLPDIAVDVDGRVLVPPSRAARLLAFLAVEPVRHTRGRVATALWPVAYPDRAHASLRAAVFALPPELRGLVVLSAGGIELAPDVVVDLRLATQAALALLSDDTQIPDAETLLRLGHEVLAGWSEEWLTCHQVRYAQLRAQALEVSVDRFSRRGLHGLAVDAALAARDCDPLRESAHLALVRAHAAQGNRYQAIEAYRAYARMLNDELGIRPQVQLSELVSSDLTGQRSPRRLVAVAPTAPGRLAR
jgi:DNA-binding SARP family transcriptional activator